MWRVVDQWWEEDWVFGLEYKWTAKNQLDYKHKYCY